MSPGTRSGPRFLGRCAAGLLAVLVIGGWVGGVSFLVDPSGSVLGMSRAQLPPWPLLDDYSVPGAVLVLGFGVLPIVALVLLARNHRWAWPAVAAGGALLVLWMLVQLAAIGPLFPAMQGGFLVLGALLLILGIVAAAPVRRRGGRR